MLTPYEEELAKKLQRGDKKKIAEKLGLHVNTVSRVVAGCWSNDSVWKEVIAIIKARQEIEQAKIDLVISQPPLTSQSLLSS